MEFVIGGYTLDKLKKIQAAVKKDASKIIADHTKLGMDAVDKVIPLIEALYDGDDEDRTEEDTKELSDEINALAKVAHDNLEIVKVVSAVSDVTFYIPFSEEYSSDGNAHRIEDYSYEDDHMDSVKELYSILEDMESDSCNWHSSRC